MTNFVNVNNAKTIYKTFKKDKIKNANIIIELLKMFESKDRKVLRKALAVIHKIFCQLITDGDIKDIHSNNTKEVKNPKVKYDKWLYERYEEVHEILLKIVLNQEIAVPLREISLFVVLKLIQKETNYPTTKEKIHKISFPIQRLTNLYRTLFSSSQESSAVIKKMKDYLRSPDFLFVSLHVLSQILPTWKKQDGGASAPFPPLHLGNLISVLELVNFPEEGKKPLDTPQLFINSANDKTGDDDEQSLSFDFKYDEAKKNFNVIWEVVLKCELDTSLCKRCLVLIPEKILAHLETPVRLTDFFMNAYNLGGVSSILAMHGVYILVTQYNLEYPDFYTKVYDLFKPTIFHAKYRARFFILCNKFFLSPYLPEYIVAAFVKRCSRLMLSAPSPCLVLLSKFVVNLLLRYPSLERLTNHPEATPAGVEDDPFLADEPNPLLCRAGESSLWEVATLRQHPLCGVNKAANFINRNMPDVEHDIGYYVHNSYGDMYQKASKIRESHVATTFSKPDGLFLYSDDAMSDTWELF